MKPRSTDPRPRRLEKQVVIITGAGRGLGQSIATTMAGEGARIVLVARTRTQLEETAVAVRDAGGEALVVPVDVTAEGGPEQAVQAALETYGGVDTLVYCAGVSVTRAALEVTAEDWDYVLGINLKAAFFWAQACARNMVKRGHGRIIFLSSVTGQAGMPWLSPYTASKAGLAGLTRGLAAEWGSAGICVNTIAAGFVKTELTTAELSDPRLAKRITQRAPLGRLGEPSDIAGSAVFLASAESSYMTGHVLVVDGGWLAA